RFGNVVPFTASPDTDAATRAGIATESDRPAVVPAPGSSTLSSLRLRHLLGPLPAMPRLRRLFDPRGWFRRLEREVNFQLSAHVYPHIPGIALPYAAQLERLLTVSEAEIPLEGLPAAFAGMKLLLITDIHVGPFLRPDTLRRAFDRLRTLAPDLIVIGGD